MNVLIANSYRYKLQVVQIETAFLTTTASFEINELLGCLAIVENVEFL